MTVKFDAILLGLLLAATITPAHALLLVFTDRTAWETAVGGSNGVEDFNAFCNSRLRVRS